MSAQHVSLSAVLVLTLSLVAIGACEGEDSSSPAAKQGNDSKSSSTGSSDKQDEQGGGAEDDDSNGEAPPEDLYPEMQFGKLSDGGRRTFVDVAKQELCPCPDSNTSLHKCLKDESFACALAKRSATVVAQGIEKGLSKDDVLARLAKFLEEARKEYEFELSDVPHRGPTDAPVRIVEFADFECPHCKKASKMLEDLTESFDGQVVHYFKHFPLPAHDQARTAARAAVAAHMQGKFWPMHDLLFENQRSLSREKIVRFARRIGLNFGKFKKDMKRQETADRVNRDREEGMDAGITGTPALFINGSRFIGSLKKQELVAAVEAELEADSEQSSSGDESPDGEK